MILLRGERCTVRAWHRADAESLERHANNIKVARNLRDRFPHPYTAKEARAFLRHVAGEQDPSNLAIDVGGAAVGAVGYVSGRDIERFSAEIGYWLGEEFWGRGIATEAVVLLTDYAFQQLHYLRLFALPFADNLASARVLEKAGYVQEAVLRASSVKYGVPKDQLLYARINPTWRNPEGTAP